MINEDVNKNVRQKKVDYSKIDIITAHQNTSIQLPVIVLFPNQG